MLPLKRKLQNETSAQIANHSEDSDDTEQWEAVPNATNTTQPDSLEITIPTKINKSKNKISKRDRIIRQLEHKSHLLCLLVTGTIWNNYLNDKYLQSILYSILPLNVIDSFSKPGNNIKKLQKLLKSWKQIFTKDVDNNETLINYKTLLDHSIGSSRIPAAIYCLLFVSVCRAIGLVAKLVLNIIPIPLSFRKTTKSSQCLQILGEIHFNEILIVDPLSGFIDTCVKNDFLDHVSYVVAFDHNNNAKDVTRRYTSKWTQAVTRLRLPEPECGTSWWDITIWLLSKNCRTEKDDHEDKALVSYEIDNEIMPTAIAGFKNQY
jgi:hypothetical protein